METEHTCLVCGNTIETGRVADRKTIEVQKGLICSPECYQDSCRWQNQTVLQCYQEDLP